METEIQTFLQTTHIIRHSKIINKRNFFPRKMENHMMHIAKLKHNDNWKCACVFVYFFFNETWINMGLLSPRTAKKHQHKSVINRSEAVTCQIIMHQSDSSANQIPIFLHYTCFAWLFCHLLHCYIWFSCHCCALFHRNDVLRFFPRYTFRSINIPLRHHQNHTLSSHISHKRTDNKWTFTHICWVSRKMVF